MSRGLLLSSVFLVVLGASLAIRTDPSVEPLINNGPEATIQDFPYVLSLRRNGVHIGGGTIISATWALSAAHILLGCPATQLTMRAGSHERLLGGSLHNAQSVTIHNQFGAHNLENNIAIIGVLEPFVWSNTVSFIRLDIQGEGSSYVWRTLVTLFLPFQVQLFPLALLAPLLDSES